MSDDGNQVDLQDAIRDASAHLGVEYEPSPEAPAPVYRGPSPISWPVVGVAVTALLVAIGAFMVDQRPAAPDNTVVEAELRWAAAHVVREVERLRSTLGHLPDETDLQVVLSDAITYRPSGDGYVVTGARGVVEVVYDGQLPLELWEALELYEDGP